MIRLDCKERRDQLASTVRSLAEIWLEPHRCLSACEDYLVSDLDQGQGPGSCCWDLRNWKQQLIPEEVRSWEPVEAVAAAFCAGKTGGPLFQEEGACGGGGAHLGSAALQMPGFQSSRFKKSRVRVL